MVDNLTVVVPFYQGHKTIRRLIESLPPGLPIILVDDQSDPPLQRESWMGANIKITRTTHKGYFAGAVNTGIMKCKTDVLVLNQDVWFESVQAFTMLERERAQYAMIGERISGEHPSFGSFGYIHGVFMFLRRDAMEEIGLLNEQDYPLWGNTAEWQWRAARHGYDIHPRTIPGMYHERPKEEAFGSSISLLLKKEPEKRQALITTPPLLSVIVPCCNYARYLRDCIASLIGGNSSLGKVPGQTLQSFEVIIVDDASTDDTPEVMAELVDIKKGIRGYRLEQNQGTAKTLNYGIDRAQGKYITFLSADDMREPSSLENLVRACQDHPHTFAYDDIWLFFKHKRIKAWDMEDYDFDRLIYKNQVHAGIVYPKKAWEEVGGYPGVMGDGREDWAFNVALGMKGWCGTHVRQYGYLYRRENQNRSLTNTSPEHHDKYFKKISGLFPEAYGGNRPMACCGKGRTNPTKSPAQVSQQSLVAKRTQFTNGSGGIVMANAGVEGWVKLEYVGKGMTSVYDGPVTNTRYRFGKDGHTTGWVDARDAGVRGSGDSGFLNKKNGQGVYIFEQIDGGNAAPAAESVVAQPVKTKQTATQGVDPQVDPTVVIGDAPEVTQTEAKVDFPDPAELNASEIRGLDLTKEQWQAVYQSEMDNKNRKSVVTYIEEKLASD